MGEDLIILPHEGKHVETYDAPSRLSEYSSKHLQRPIYSSQVTSANVTLLQQMSMCHQRDWCTSHRKCINTCCHKQSQSGSCVLSATHGQQTFMCVYARARATLPLTTQHLTPPISADEQSVYSKVCSTRLLQAKQHA